MILSSNEKRFPTINIEEEILVINDLTKKLERKL